MTHSSRRILSALAAVALATVPVLGRQAPAAVVLAVAGRTNAYPSVAADGSFVAVAWGAAASGGRSDVFVATSRDAGAHFDAPVRVNTVAGEGRLGGEMPPRVGLRALTKGAYEVTVLWTARTDATTIKLARSTDSGRTFAAARELQSAGAAGDRGWPALAIDPGGTAQAIWLDHRAMARGGSAGTHVHGQSAGSGEAVPPPSGLFFARAGAGAPAAERQIATGVCYCCKTALAAGPGGAVYAAWRQVYAGNIRDIAFAASRDGGRSFTAPVRISEDRWQINGCPDDGPALAVDGRGTVHVVWPTVVAADGKAQGALFYASTRDGRQFTPRLRIETMGSPKPSHPQVAVLPGGGLMIGWDEVVDGKRGAFARALTIDPAGRPVFGAVQRLGGEGGAYPALAVTSAGPLAVWTSGSGDASAIAVRAIGAPAN